MYKIYVKQCFGIILQFIVTIIVNKRYVVLIIVHITMLLFAVR
jgi:hypothetical protein